MTAPRRALVMVVAATALLASCGIPRDTEPALLPGGVVNPALAATEGQAPSGEGAEIFLVRDDQLDTVRRSPPGPGLAGVLELLLQGPTQAEFGSGTRTAISPQTTLRSARVDGDTAVVDLSGALVEVGGQEQILAVAQIVLTATAVPGVGQVRLLLEGEAVEVPRSDGTLTSDTLRAGDYAGLVR